MYAETENSDSDVIVVMIAEDLGGDVAVSAADSLLLCRLLPGHRVDGPGVAAAVSTVIVRAANSPPHRQDILPELGAGADVDHGHSGAEHEQKHQLVVKEDQHVVVADQQQDGRWQAGE